jgi:GDPmannose 4,6-dehydratase
MKVLITGIGGFVGSRLADTILTRGTRKDVNSWEVYGVVRRHSKYEYPPNLTELGIERQVNLLYGDIKDGPRMKAVMAEVKPDIVFHLAAQAYVPDSYANPTETYVTNINGTQNILEAMKESCNKDVPFVFAGSSEEYGAVKLEDLPLNENSPRKPISPYGVTKVVGEDFCIAYHKMYGMNTIRSRAFNHEGAGRGDMYVTSKIAKRVCENKVLTLGNVCAFRDWSHIHDICNGYIHLAEHGKAGEVYVQGSGEMYSVLSYALMSLKDKHGDIVNMDVSHPGDRTIKFSMDDPLSDRAEPPFNNAIDQMIGRGFLELPQATSIGVTTENGIIRHIYLDPIHYRPLDVPYLLADASKIGLKHKHSIKDIISDLINYHDDRKGWC